MLNWFLNSSRKNDLPIYRVVFVCTGNTCRSPMAEGLLKKMVEEQGAQMVNVTSAGTHAVDGQPANFLAISVSSMNEINLLKHRARLITKKIMERSDLIFALAQNHYDFLAAKFPKYIHKVHLLKNYAREEPLEEADVFDPIGAEGEVFREVFEDIKTELERVAVHVINESLDNY